MFYLRSLREGIANSSTAFELHSGCENDKSLSWDYVLVLKLRNQV